MFLVRLIGKRSPHAAMISRASMTSSLSWRLPGAHYCANWAIGRYAGRQITHPRRPSEFDALGYPEANTCTCIRPAGHDHGCWCEHNIGRYVYRVDADLHEHHPTRSLGTRQ
jgi:hypothetical protein